MLRPIRRIALGAIVTAAALAIVTAPALAASPTVFSNVQASFPPNVPSLGYEATTTSEFGDLIELAGTERSGAKLPVTIVMSIWACETGGDATCVTTPGDTWNQDLTLSIYNVDETGATPVTNGLVYRSTKTFKLPFRPSFDPAGPCAATGTGWEAANGSCYNGLAHSVTFFLPSTVTLPDRLVWGLAFNTTHRGYSPVGGPGGYWDSLNVGLTKLAPSVGHDVDASSAFISNSSAAGSFAASGDLGTYAPIACFGACPAVAPNPTEAVGGETGAPGRTPPPTSSDSAPDGGPSTYFLLMIGVAFGSFGIVAVGAQRRKIA